MLLRAVVLASVAGVLAVTSLACSGTDGALAESTIDPTTGQPVDTSPPDGTKNGDETDVDCGGSRVEKCADGKGCVKGADCQSGVCKQSTCAAPGPDDGIKNADETDVDCGGAKAPKCSVGKSCGKHDDCESDACSYAKKCVEAKGCTAHAGGDTCGEGESGTAGAKHESCCKTMPIADFPGGAIEMDKFHVTAGRMRAMIERYDGNLQAWAATGPKGWNDAWTSKLPTNISEALYMLGPGEKQGCNVASQGGRTYWQDAIDGNAAEKSDFSKDVLDEKALNCVPWHLAQAVCHWDGGRLASASEIAHVFENRGRAGGKTNYPWEWKGGAAPYNPSVADIRLVHVNSYQTPNPPAAMRLVNGQYPLDHAFWIAPPGRRPTGANMHGVQDIAGNVLHWVDDGQRNFVSTLSWERHGKSLTASTYDTRYTLGYYAVGARCVKQ